MSFPKRSSQKKKSRRFDRPDLLAEDKRDDKETIPARMGIGTWRSWRYHWNERRNVLPIAESLVWVRAHAIGVIAGRGERSLFDGRRGPAGAIF